MKRLLMIVLAAVLLVSLCITPFNAATGVPLQGEKDPVPIQAESQLSVRDKLRLHLSRITYGRVSEPYYYEELYTHKDVDGNTDWVLIYAEGGEETPWYACGVVGHLVTITSQTLSLFKFNVGLYDAKADTFIDLSQLKDYSKYDGLIYAIDTYAKNKRLGDQKGRFLGDIDRDETISILDVTIIQRCEAGMRAYPESDSIGYYDNAEEFEIPPRYYSDFNRDGERDILDATAIQRYLSHMHYATGS